MGFFVAPPVEVRPVTASVRGPQENRAVALPWGAIRPITASAQQIKLDSIVPNRPYSLWQQEAWTGYEKIGEIHYGLGLVANILSRVRLFAAAIVDSESAPENAREAADADHLDRRLALAATEVMADLTATDFPAMLRSFALNISVPGECYLIRLPDKLPDQIPAAAGRLEPVRPVVQTYTWVIRSTDEVRIRAGSVELVPMRGATQETRILPKETFVARIWRSNARFSMEPDSSMAGISDPIEELLLFSRLVRSTVRSRLNAGLLFMPDGISVAGNTRQPDENGAVDTGALFIDQLMDAMVTPISDEGNASAVVPMLITGPGDLGAMIKHITFDRHQDEWLPIRAERSLERVLQGLDVPKEIVTGMANVKYANALVIDDNLYRANIEPLCLMLSDSLTQAYLRPVLRAQGLWTEEDLDRVCVWYDPSEIVTRPNAGADATEGYNLGLLSPAAWRREHGFPESDAPTEAELAFMLASRQGVAMPPDVVAALFQQMLPETLGAKRDENIANSATPFPQSAKDLLQPGTNPGEVAQAAGEQP